MIAITIISIIIIVKAPVTIPVTIPAICPADSSSSVGAGETSVVVAFVGGSSGVILVMEMPASSYCDSAAYKLR